MQKRQMAFTLTGLMFFKIHFVRSQVMGAVIGRKYISNAQADILTMRIRLTFLKDNNNAIQTFIHGLIIDSCFRRECESG